MFFKVSFCYPLFSETVIPIGSKFDGSVGSENSRTCSEIHQIEGPNWYFSKQDLVLTLVAKGRGGGWEEECESSKGVICVMDPFPETA